MNALQRKMGRFPLGIWIAVAALFLTLIAWATQAYSLINWEAAVKLGLQTGSFTGDAVQQTIANKERGEAIADMLWPLPIAIVALIGLFRNKLIGFTAAMMEFAICIYFPLFYAFQLWQTHMDTVLAALFLWAIPSFLGITGLWANRENFIL